MHEPADTEYSSTAQPAMQGSVEARGASKAQPEVGSTRRKPSESKPVKPEGETADASRKFTAGVANGGRQPAQAGGCSSRRRKPEVATADGESRKLNEPAELKDDARCESGVIAGLAGGRTPTQVGRSAASRSEARSTAAKAGCLPPSRARRENTDPSRRGWPAVEPESGQSTQVGS